MEVSPPAPIAVPDALQRNVELVALQDDISVRYGVDSQLVELDDAHESFVHRYVGTDVGEDVKVLLSGGIVLSTITQLVFDGKRARVINAVAGQPHFSPVAKATTATSSVLAATQDEDIQDATLYSVLVDLATEAMIEQLLLEFNEHDDFAIWTSDAELWLEQDWITSVR